MPLPSSRAGSPRPRQRMWPAASAVSAALALRTRPGHLSGQSKGKKAGLASNCEHQPFLQTALSLSDCVRASCGVSRSSCVLLALSTVSFTTPALCLALFFRTPWLATLRMSSRLVPTLLHTVPRLPFLPPSPRYASSLSASCPRTVAFPTPPRASASIHPSAVCPLLSSLLCPPYPLFLSSRLLPRPSSSDPLPSSSSSLSRPLSACISLSISTTTPPFVLNPRPFAPSPSPPPLPPYPPSPPPP